MAHRDDDNPELLDEQYEQHNIKDLSEEELFQHLLDAGPEWSEQQRQLVIDAYEVGRTLHAGDRPHRELPYVYHLLRNANRIVKYLHSNDPEIIAGIILHDAVEDHPDELITYQLARGAAATETEAVPLDLHEKQQAAIRRLEEMFTPRIARMVDGMTNPPKDPNARMSRAEWLQTYVDHVEEAIQNPDVFIGKWSDWVDNGVGIVHSDSKLRPEDAAHYREKYGLVLPVLRARFYMDDIQAMLDPIAKENIKRTFELARQRLEVPDDLDSLGAVALSRS